MSKFTWVTFRNDDHITFHDLCVCFYFFPFIRFRFTSFVNLFKALNNFLVRLFNRENVESVNRLYIPPVLCVCFFSITFNDDEKLHFALIFPFRFVCVSWRIFRVSRLVYLKRVKYFHFMNVSSFYYYYCFGLLRCLSWACWAYMMSKWNGELFEIAAIEPRSFRNFQYWRWLLCEAAWTTDYIERTVNELEVNTWISTEYKGAANRSFRNDDYYNYLFIFIGSVVG